MVHTARVWTGLIDHSTLYGALRLEAARYDKASGKTTGAGHGTGFMISATIGQQQERARFLVTNRHVMDPGFGEAGDATKGQGRLSVIGHRQVAVTRGDIPPPTLTEVAFPELQPIYSQDPNLDIALVPVDDAPKEVIRGDGYFNTFKETLIAPPWGYIDGDIHPGMQVLAAGYPAFEQCEPPTRPIFAGGIVASDPRYPAEFGGNAYTDVVLCHAFSKSGMSGAPVFAAIRERRELDRSSPERTLKIIGINAGHMKTSNESTDGVISRFVKATALLILLAGQGSSWADMMVTLGRLPESQFE